MWCSSSEIEHWFSFTALSSVSKRKRVRILSGASLNFRILYRGRMTLGKDRVSLSIAILDTWVGGMANLIWRHFETVARLEK